jgi:chromate transporter
MLQHGTKPVYSFSALSRCFLKLGSNGFGGPVSLMGYRHKNLVEENQ